MHKYEWDPVTGGILLLPQQEKSSREPRPVYYREMNLLGMDKRWKYPQNDDAPIMWAEAERYIYRGRMIARTKGGGLFQQPELIYTETEEGIPAGEALTPVDVELMIAKNAELLDNLLEETAKKIYSTYIKYRNRIDLFYVAFRFFSGIQEWNSLIHIKQLQPSKLGAKRPALIFCVQNLLLHLKRLGIYSVPRRQKYAGAVQFLRQRLRFCCFVI